MSKNFAEWANELPQRVEQFNRIVLSAGGTPHRPFLQGETVRAKPASTEYEKQVAAIMRFTKVEPDDQRHEIATTTD